VSAPPRHEILEEIRTLVGGRHVVRWSDARTMRGGFEGAGWTIDVFDVPAPESFELGRRFGTYRRELSRRHGIGLTIVTHTPEATEKHFPWVRDLGAGDLPSPPVFTATMATAIGPGLPPRPHASFEFGIRR
jgi:hypothetical protein